MPGIKWTSCCALVMHLILRSLSLSVIFMVKHCLFSILLIIAWNKQSPLGLAFNIPAFSPNPCLIPVDIAFCSTVVVCLLAVVMLCADMGGCLLWSMLGAMCFFIFPFLLVSCIFVTQVAKFVCFLMSLATS